MICPKCGRPVSENAVICQGCNFILDTGFLGEEILDEDKTLRPGKGGIDPAVFNLADAVILGSIENKPQSFETGDSGFNIKESTGARLYVSGLTKAVMAPDAILEIIETSPTSLKLSPFEEHVLQFIDGEKPVDKIRKAAGLDETEVKTALATLADKGIIKVTGRALMELGDNNASLPKRPAGRKRALNALAGSMGGISDETDRAIDEAFRTEAGVGPLSQEERLSLKTPADDGTGVFSDIESSSPSKSEKVEKSGSSLDIVSAIPLSSQDYESTIASIQPGHDEDLDMDVDDAEQVDLQSKASQLDRDSMLSSEQRPDQSLKSATRRIPSPNFSRESDGFDSFGSPSEVVGVTRAQKVDPLASSQSEPHATAVTDRPQLSDVFDSAAAPDDGSPGFDPINRDAINQIAHSGLIDANDFADFTGTLSFSATPQDSHSGPDLSSDSAPSIAKNAATDPKTETLSAGADLIEALGEEKESSNAEPLSSESPEANLPQDEADSDRAQQKRNPAATPSKVNQSPMEPSLESPTQSLRFLESNDSSSAESASAESASADSLRAESVRAESASAESASAESASAESASAESASAESASAESARLEGHLDSSQSAARPQDNEGDDENVFISLEDGEEAPGKAGGAGQTALSVIDLPSGLSDLDDLAISQHQNTNDDPRSNEASKADANPMNGGAQDQKGNDDMGTAATLPKYESPDKERSIMDASPSTDDASSSLDLDSDTPNAAREEPTPEPDGADDNADAPPPETSTQIADLSEVGIGLSELSVGLADSGIFRTKNISGEKGAVAQPHSDDKEALDSKFESAVSSVSHIDDPISSIAEVESLEISENDRPDEGSELSSQASNADVSIQDGAKDIVSVDSEVDRPLMTNELPEFLESDYKSEDFSSSHVFTSSGKKDNLGDGAAPQDSQNIDATTNHERNEKSIQIAADPPDDSDATIQFELPEGALDTPESNLSLKEDPAFRAPKPEGSSEVSNQSDAQNMDAKEELDDNDDDDDDDITHIHNTPDLASLRSVSDARQQGHQADGVINDSPSDPLEQIARAGKLKQEQEAIAKKTNSAQLAHRGAQSSVEYIEEDMIIRPTGGSADSVVDQSADSKNRDLSGEGLSWEASGDGNNQDLIGQAQDSGLAITSDLDGADIDSFHNKVEDESTNMAPGSLFNSSDSGQADVMTRYESGSNLPAPADDSEATEFLEVSTGLQELLKDDSEDEDDGSGEWGDEATENIDSNQLRDMGNRGGGQASRVFDEISGRSGVIPSSGFSEESIEVPQEKLRQGRELYEQALQDFEAGYLNRAKQNLKLATICAPNQDEYRETLAAWEAAESIQEEARDQAPEIKLYELAHKCEASGDIDSAIALLREGIELKPDLAPFHNRLGVILAINKNDFVNAAKSVGLAVSLEPDNLHYKNNLSKIVAKGNIKMDAPD
jgi:tetratricopeptide (TPR) repeat protein